MFTIPAYGKTTEIRPGLHWLRMPLTFELNHVNVWLLQSQNGWDVIDCAFDNADTVAHWNNIFKTLMPEKSVRHIFVTHFHPDHFGLAGWLHTRTGGAPVLMTQGEMTMMRSLSNGGSEEKLKKDYTPFYVAAGVPAPTATQLLERRMMYKKIISTPPRSIDTVKESETVILGGKKFQVVIGRGHSPAHACLYDAESKLFVAGDIVLPTITPNISYFPGDVQGADPLADYLATLAHIRKAIPDDVLVLPSHGQPFHGLHKRIEGIIAHHERRLEKIRDICELKALTAFGVMQMLFSHRKLSPADLFFALSETIAHLRYDTARGQIIETDEKGVKFYRLAGAA